MYENLQNWLTIATYRVSCRKIQKVCLGNPKAPVKGLELMVVCLTVSNRRQKFLQLKSEWSVLKGWNVCTGTWKMIPKVKKKQQQFLLLHFSFIRSWWQAFLVGSSTSKIMLSQITWAFLPQIDAIYKLPQ